MMSLRVSIICLAICFMRYIAFRSLRVNYQLVGDQRQIFHFDLSRYNICLLMWTHYIGSAISNILILISPQINFNYTFHNYIILSCSRLWTRWNSQDCHAEILIGKLTFISMFILYNIEVSNCDFRKGLIQLFIYAYKTTFL